MPDLAAIYDAAFFAEWGKGNEPYVRTAAVVAGALHEQLRPRRVADLGCGCGVYAHELARRGVEALALDGVTPPAEHAFPVAFHAQDLTVPFENRWGRFDLALCLEVAEHIPEPLSDAFLDNVTRFSDLVVMSAAPPYQGGHHHVNERPKRYWVARMAERGFAYDRARTGRLFETVLAARPPLLWMAQHVGVYERMTGPLPSGRTLPFGVR